MAFEATGDMKVLGKVTGYITWWVCFYFLVGPVLGRKPGGWEEERDVDAGEGW